MKTTTHDNQTLVNQQVILCDTPQGIPVKTRIKAGESTDAKHKGLE